MAKTLSETLKKMDKNDKKKLFKVLILTISVTLVLAIASFFIFTSILNTNGSRSKKSWEDIYTGKEWIYSSGKKVLGDRIEFVDKVLVRSYNGGSYTEYEMKHKNGDDYFIDSLSAHFSTNSDGSYLITIRDNLDTGYYKIQ